MKKLLVTLIASLVMAGAGVADDSRPPSTTNGFIQTEILAQFSKLTPNTQYQFLTEAHFENGSVYYLGGSNHVPSSADGWYKVEVTLDDLAYDQPNVSLEWVRVCVVYPFTQDQVYSSDGQAACMNVDTGDFQYYKDTHEPALASAEAAQEVAAFTANASGVSDRPVTPCNPYEGCGLAPGQVVIPPTRPDPPCNPYRLDDPCNAGKTPPGAVIKNPPRPKIPCNPYRPQSCNPLKP